MVYDTNVILFFNKTNFFWNKSPKNHIFWHYKKNLNRKIFFVLWPFSPRCTWCIHIRKSEVTQPCAILCNPMDCSLPASSENGISKARILVWVTVSVSRRYSRPRDWTQVSCIVCTFFTTQGHQGSPSSVRLHQSSLSGVFCMHLEFSSYMSTQFSCFPSPVLLHSWWADFTFISLFSEFLREYLINVSIGINDWY